MMEQVEPLRLKLLEIGTSESAGTDFVIVDEADSALDVLAGNAAIYCQVADRLTGEIFVKSVNCFPEMLGVLKAIEWGAEVDAVEGDFVAGCPHCGAEKRGGTHHDDCQLAGVIAKAEGR